MLVNDRVFRKFGGFGLTPDDIRARAEKAAAEILSGLNALAWALPPGFALIKEWVSLGLLPPGATAAVLDSYPVLREHYNKINSQAQAAHADAIKKWAYDTTYKKLSYTELANTQSIPSATRQAEEARLAAEAKAAQESIQASLINTVLQGGRAVKEAMDAEAAAKTEAQRQAAAAAEATLRAEIEMKALQAKLVAAEREAAGRASGIATLEARQASYYQQLKFAIDRANATKSQTDIDSANHQLKIYEAFQAQLPALIAKAQADAAQAAQQLQASKDALAAQMSAQAAQTAELAAKAAQTAEVSVADVVAQADAARKAEAAKQAALESQVVALAQAGQVEAAKQAALAVEQAKVDAQKAEAMRTAVIAKEVESLKTAQQKASVASQAAGGTSSGSSFPIAPVLSLAVLAFKLLKK